jgi:diadenosine tetraphosphatase ApaH/serine/threonine PP2A family protein phosphatase
VRTAIFGDVHANLPALRAVLDAIGREDVGQVLCLGDLVGYGADPAPCVDLVRETGAIVVGGNHDLGAAGRLGLAYFNAAARSAIEWTRDVLRRDQVAWLATLPLLRAEGDVTLAHATLHDPAVFDYLVTPYDAWLSFRHLTTPLAFVGHSHVPVAFFEGNPVFAAHDERVEIDGRRVIANVGSVGQPRDGNPDASFGILDPEARLLTVRRVAYDVDAAARRIREVGLPGILADRLHLGR